MITFKQYLNEMADPQGNYVAIQAESQKNFFNKMEKPQTGTPPPDNDYHCTLMYSKTTFMDPALVLKELTKFDGELVAAVTGVDCFDSPPKEGSRDPAKSCIVLKLDCPQLVHAHNHLKAIGLQHSYPEFSPHVTLLYNVAVDEAHYFKDKLNKMRLGYIILSNFTSATINTNYV